MSEIDAALRAEVEETLVFASAPRPVMCPWWCSLLHGHAWSSWDASDGSVSRIHERSYGMAMVAASEWWIPGTGLVRGEAVVLLDPPHGDELSLSQARVAVTDLRAAADLLGEILAGEA